MIVTETLGVDGPERVISELSQEWDRKGYSITIVVTRNNNKISVYSFSDNVTIKYIDAYEKGGKFARINEIIELRKILKKHPARTCISLMISTSFSLAFASIGLNKRVILSERNDPSRVPFTSFQRMLRNLSFELADRIVFQTQDAMDYFPTRIKRKGKIIYNPVNPNLPEKYEGIRDKRIVAAGRLADQKNFALLIRAYSDLYHVHPDYSLTIYGEGNKREELQGLIDNLGMAENIHMPGFSNNIYNEMARSAIYVSSSNYEGMSNSMLEALAMGIPTICTDCPIGGARTVIKSNVNGILVDVGNEDTLYQSMCNIIENPALANRLSTEAYCIREKLDIRVISQEWENLF